MKNRLDIVARLFGYDTPQAFPWQELRYEHILAVRAHYSDLKRAPSTVNGILCAVVGVARHAWRLGLLSGEEYQRVVHIERAKGSRLPPGRKLEQEELAAMLDACTRDPRPIGARDAGIIGLMAGTGLRRFEVGLLDLANYDRRTGELRVLGKGNKERMGYLSGGAAAAVNAWLEVRGEKLGPLFYAMTRHGQLALPRRRIGIDTVERVLRHRAGQAGLEHFSTHDMRRTFITVALKQGADLFAVQDLAGHASPVPTKKYDRRGDEIKRHAASLVEVPYTPKTKT
jgi:integrase